MQPAIYRLAPGDSRLNVAVLLFTFFLIFLMTRFQKPSRQVFIKAERQVMVIQVEGRGTLASRVMLWKMG